MQVFALLQIAALQVLARPQTPVVKPLRLIFKRGGAATKTSRGIALPGGLRGQGFRAYEKRTVARVSRGGGVGQPLAPMAFNGNRC